jgi:hypothetical protein
MAAGGACGGERLFEAFIVSAATEVGDKVTPVMMFCFAPDDAHLMQYKPVPGMTPSVPSASLLGHSRCMSIFLNL